MKLEPFSPLSLSMIAENTLLAGHIVKERWKVISKIGQGAFGEVYKCEDLRSKKTVALKSFCKLVRNSGSNLLKIEMLVLRELKGKDFFPKFVGYGKTERFDYLVMELLGGNLHQIKKRNQLDCFTLSTAVRLGEMMLTSLHNLHMSGYIHKDVKPANFAIGYGADKKKLYIIDFGFAKKYIGEDGAIVPRVPRVNYRGTPRYSSASVLKGNDASRADDLISLFYTLYELFVGDLPWKAIKAYTEMAVLKREFDHQLLLFQMPEGFAEFYDHVSNLGFYDEPNYSKLYQVFHSIKDRRAIKDSDEFDFEVTKPSSFETSPKRGSVSTLPTRSEGELICEASSTCVTIQTKTSLKTSQQNVFFSFSSLSLPEQLSACNKNQEQPGIPLCWSCPTFSLFIRSNLKPPLKQFASINENVYEVDVRRNVAAKRIEDCPRINGRRNSLPYIFGTENPMNDNSGLESKTEVELQNNFVNLRMEESLLQSHKEEISKNYDNNADYDHSIINSNPPVEKLNDICQNGVSEELFKDNISFSDSENHNNKNNSHSNNLCQPKINENIECNPQVENQIFSSISEKIIELLVEEHSLFSGMYLPCANLNDTPCKNEINSVTKSEISEVFSIKCPVKDQKPVMRRHRNNPENKYVKDESELKLNFYRRQRLSLNPSINHTGLQHSDECVLQRINTNQSVPMFNGQTFPEFFQDQSMSTTLSHEMLQPPHGEPPYPCLPSRRVRYRRAVTSMNNAS